MIKDLLLPIYAMFALVLLRFIFASPKDKRVLSKRDARLVMGLRLAGFVFLLAGFLAAFSAYRSTPSTAEKDGTSIGNSSGAVGYMIMSGPTKKQEYAMEQIGGKANIWAVEVTDSFVSLWHGRNLAYTLAGLFVVCFLVCFFFARLLTLPEHG